MYLFFNTVHDIYFACQFQNAQNIMMNMLFHKKRIVSDILFPQAMLLGNFVGHC